MAILNYTTKISIEKTVSEIQKRLAMAGAKAILCEYNDAGIVSALSFRISTKHGIVSFKLPANIDGVFRCLIKKQVPKKLRTKEQASRVAWRIIKDWIEAQCAIVEAEIADITEVFLPYAINKDNKTMYESIKENGLKMITCEVVDG